MNVSSSRLRLTLQIASETLEQRTVEVPNLQPLKPLNNYNGSAQTTASQWNPWTTYSGSAQTTASETLEQRTVEVPKLQPVKP